MSITFSIVTSADDSCDLYAVLASEQLTHFLDILRAESDRSNTVLLDGEGDLAAMLSDGFEARVCPVALAVLARVFDYDCAVIAVIDEAQFRRRKITIWRDKRDGSIKMCPSFTSDADAEMTLPTGHAFALLAGLGVETWTIGERPVRDIRRALAESATTRRMAAGKVAHYVPGLQRLLDTAHFDDSSRLAWA